MDFDKPEVYGDTSITDGLVLKRLVQDARFGLDKDEQTTFIDSQGKLNPKAVKWSEVGLA